MRTLLFGAWMTLAATASAQTVRPAATLRVTVVDPSGAVIVGAQVTVRPASNESLPVQLATGNRGDAFFPTLEPGRHAIHVESPGFEPYIADDVRLRAGANRRDVRLEIAKIAATVQVGRDPRERASDPRGDAFATVLSPAEIDELPDDPDEMEQVLRDMAGPGATLRVNGFRGGKLPPKSQIQQIRFRRNMFAADAHEPGFVSVDILTRPGLDGWRGATTIAFRDAALNARNAFAPVKGDERHERYGFNLSGPLWKQHTSLSLSVDGADAFESRTIVAALPNGYFADSIRKPTDSLNVTARLEHGLTRSQMLRVEAQRNHTVNDNLGAGDFDLAERAYRQARTESVVRASMSGSIRKALFNELRAQVRRDESAFDPATDAPAVLVLNAFGAGGAQIAGTGRVTDFEITDDLDVAIGRHALRTGFLLDGGSYTTNVVRNGGGTFTFASLAAFAAGTPTTFSRTVGDPRVSVSQVQAGVYLQDDFRARKDLTISGGVRQEVQSHVGGLRLAPRGGVAWSPFKNGKTTVRAGGGIFYDWFDAQSYQQAVQLDGTHQRIDTILRPGYPDPLFGGVAMALPAGRVQLASNLEQPELREMMAGIERQLPWDIRLQAMYVHRAGRNLLRGINVNAPLSNGERPVADAGPITVIDSIASSRTDLVSVNVNLMKPQRRVMIAAGYTLGRSTNEADTAFALPADSYNLAAERGPAPNDARHRFMSLVNTPLAGRFRLGVSMRAQSALPFDITTGRDDNGDTVSNDRPAGVTRNSGRGLAQFDLGARLSWSIGFGTRPSAPQGPQVRILRGDNADPLGAMGGDPQATRYGLEFYVQSYNVLNRMNALNVSGVLASPFFGQPTSAAAPRRIEIGTRVTF